jgi:YVTN family beta-propeller protein
MCCIAACHAASRLSQQPRTLELHTLLLTDSGPAHYPRSLLSRAAPLLAAGLTAALILIGGCRAKDFPKYASNYREYAYVSSGGSNTVTVLDLVNLRLERVIAVGQNPTGITANPTRNEVYVVNTASGTVSVINAANNTVAGTILVHRLPYFIDVDTAGGRAYVANSGSNNVSVLDLATRREVAVVGVGEAPGFARIAPDGNALVVTNRGSSSVTVIDPHTLRVRAVFADCPGATDAAILPDSTKAFIACSAGHQVMALGLAHAATAEDSAVPDRLITLLDVGKTPVQLALKPDGGELFVSNFDSDTISEIATYSNEVGGAYVVGAHPSHGIVSADNSTLWISNFSADTIGVYSIDDGKLINSVHVGDGPDALAFSAAGHLLLAVNARSGDVSVVRTMSHSPAGALQIGTLFQVLPAGKRPNGIAVKSFQLP